MKRVLFALLVSLPMYGGVDLTLTGAVADPATIKPLNTKFQLTFNVKNAGNVGYSGTFRVKVPIPTGAQYTNSSYSSDGTMACSLQSSQVECSRINGAAPLAPGGTIAMRVEMKAVSAGSFSIPLEVDPDGSVAEDNEANNRVQVNGSMSDLPRVSVTKNTCPAYRAVNQIGGHAFTLTNLGTLDVRYPGIVVEVSGSGGQNIVITGVVTGSLVTTAGSPYDFTLAAPTHKFVFIPPTSKSPLLAGQNTMLTFYAKSMGVQTVNVKAFIDTIAIQDSSPKDNSASCSYPVQ
jgi:hypothetical protein